MKVKILPYKKGSKSANLLSKKLGALLVGNKPAKRWAGNNMLLCWGNDKPFEVRVKAGTKIAVVNPREALSVAKHKTRTFDALKEADVKCPEYTRDNAVAAQWATEGMVVHRTTATGQGGAGITVVERNGVVPQCTDDSFVVRYIKKRAEYRVHVFDGEVIRVQEKRRQAGFEGRNNQVRNHANGWVFCTENVEASDALKAIAIAAVGAVGLTFGAVDIIYNEHQDQHYVLEINTAPGLEGATVDAYADAVKKYADKLEAE